jgi:hypothetical protein
MKKSRIESLAFGNRSIEGIVGAVYHGSAKYGK